jgi:hypothetical protein
MLGENVCPHACCESHCGVIDYEFKFDLFSKKLVVDFCLGFKVGGF